MSKEIPNAMISDNELDPVTGGTGETGAKMEWWWCQDCNTGRDFIVESESVKRCTICGGTKWEMRIVCPVSTGND